MSPFKIEIPESTLEDLRDRLARTRWPDEIKGAGWDYGTDLHYAQELAAYWKDGFDWRKQESRLNGFAQFTAPVGGLNLHFIHERGQGENPLPLLLTHGWPDSIWRFEKLIPLLTQPEDPSDAFDVIVPSIPGFGFSEKPKQRGWTPAKIGETLYELMTKTLGYGEFGAHGGDWGSTITESIGIGHPESLVGIHLTDIPFRRIFQIPPGDLSPAEQEYLKKGQQWSMTQGGYAIVQSDVPQGLAYGLTDSPVGLAGWFLQMFRRWSDSNGDLETRFSKDELLTNLTIYWATETIASASRIYFETMHDPGKPAPDRIDVPLGAAMFPKDLVSAPREFAERIYDVRRWTEMPKGGHFAAFEEPELLAHEIREFFRPLRKSK